MLIVTAITCIAALVIAIKAIPWRRAPGELRERQRIALIRRYRFSPGLLNKLHEKLPHLAPKELQLITRGWRTVFRCNLHARGKCVSMPSQVVDDL